MQEDACCSCSSMLVFSSLSVDEAAFAWLVNRLLHGGSKKICRVFFSLFLMGFFSFFLNLSNCESDLTAAETHNDFERGFFLKKSGLGAAREPRSALF